jgi:hypothetical protein
MLMVCHLLQPINRVDDKRQCIDFNTLDRKKNRKNILYVCFIMHFYGFRCIFITFL